MDEKTTRRLYRTAETRLIRRHLTSREEILHVFNKGGVIGTDTIGPVLAKLIEDALLLPDTDWCALFPRLPLYASQMPATVPQAGEGSMTWTYAPDAVSEGHSLSVPDGV